MFAAPLRNWLTANSIERSIQEQGQPVKDFKALYICFPHVRYYKNISPHTRS